MVESVGVLAPICAETWQFLWHLSGKFTPRNDCTFHAGLPLQAKLPLLHAWYVSLVQSFLICYLIRFCYSGGFALNAAAGGASSVVAVDSSQPALDEAQINAARNGLEGKTKFVKDDALKFMKVVINWLSMFVLDRYGPPMQAFYLAAYQ